MSEFVHEALLYADEDEFLRGTVPFLEHGLRYGEPMLVAVGADKIAAIVAALVSYAVIERPFLRLKDRLARRPA